MAKELPSANVPPDVFQLFNRNRTYFFESDISSLPMPPVTVSVTPPTGSTSSNLRKSQSQPHLVVTNSSKSAVSSKISDQSRSRDSLFHLPTALMATVPSTHSDTKLQQDCAEGAALDSLQNRYQTDPAYSSSRILKSFSHEFRLFGHGVSHNAGGSVSNPTSPRRGSLSDIMAIREEDEPRPRSSSDPRKLSLVKEDVAGEEWRSDSPVTVTEHGVYEAERQSHGDKPNLVASVAVDTVDGHSPRAQALPLTRQVAGWFTTPQPRADFSSNELNALSPSSF